MLSSFSWPAASLLLGSLSLTVDALQPLSAVGSKFFYEDGTQYYMKGIAYQRTPDDPLIDVEQCKRDFSLMAELGANAIRVYHVDPDADHDPCMKAMADAGIYLFVDLDTFDTSISQDKPSWTHEQFDRFAEVMDAFHQYDNVAGFFIGNEVLNSAEGAPAAPYVLAAARDMKSYRNEQNYRTIPIGYAAADIAELRPMLQNYLACREDPAERLDFFSLNAYEWCGDSSYKTSGYVNLQKQAENYPIPIFFSETGCNVARPRLFTDQAAIFGPEMADTWSGSMVYEWIQETNDYGLINYKPAEDSEASELRQDDGFTREGKPDPIAPDFDNLKAQWATLRPTGVALADYAQKTADIKPAECPAQTEGGWDVDPKAPLPTLGQEFHSASSAPAIPTGTAPPHAHDREVKSSSSSSATGASPTGSHGSNKGTTSNNEDGNSQFTGAGSAMTASLSLVVGAVVGGLALWL